jgi:hypothetical protein
MTRPRLYLLALTLLALAILGIVHGRTSARASALFAITASCCFIAASVRR